MVNSDKFIAVSLFSGCGGMDLGFASTKKFNTILANEILEIPTETYSNHFGSKITKSNIILPDDMPAIFLGDVQYLTLQNPPEIDTVIGGPPCQDFSVIRGPQNERKGIEVHRGRLYEHFVKSLKQLQPKAFVFENVPGLMSANDGSAFETIIDDFENLNARWEDVKKDLKIENGNKTVYGYNIIFKEIVNTAELGVPQNRRRLFIVGLRKDLLKESDIETIKTLFKNSLWRRKELIKFPITTMEIFEGKTLPELQDKYKEIMKSYDGVWEEVKSKRSVKWKKEVWDLMTLDIVKDYLKANKISVENENELKKAFETHEVILKEMGYWENNVFDVKTDDGSNKVPDNGKSTNVVDRMRMIPPGENFEFVSGTKWEVDGNGMSLIYKRLHPLKPAYTVVAYGGGGTWGYHFERGRATLTNRERARLQTFPDIFLFKGNRSDVRAQIGEAVPPLAAKRIAEALIKVMEEL